MRKYNIKYVEELLATEGYTLLSKEYIGANSKISVRCPNGHEFETTFGHWKNKGRRCPHCLYESRMSNVNNIILTIENEGYKLLSEVKNTKTLFKVKCPNGHVFSTTLQRWKAGRRCKKCFFDSLRYDYNKFKKEIALEGYKLHEDNMKDYTSKTKLLCSCPSGHYFYTTKNKWRQGCRCPVCGLERVKTTLKLPLSTIKHSFENEGYTLLSNNYINAFSVLKYRCPNGHIGTTIWNDWQQGCRCAKCSYINGKSSGEELLYDFLSGYFSNIEGNNRKIISPYELDIVIPEKKIAIEYCGLYWHSELLGKDKNYHLNKLKMCEKNGYRLVTVFEDEFLNKQEIVLSRLKTILNLTSTFKRVYARNCVIKEISTKQANEFCYKNHLQGYGNSFIKLGAFYKGDLVSVMTFSKPNIAKGSKNIDGVFELNRFCSKINYSVVGIASKFLKHFKNNYEAREIFSYADRRWSDGNLYKKIGFEFKSFTKPNYWYIINNERKHRFSFRKTKYDPKELTEWEIRRGEGHNRIWDCGNIKYFMEL